MKYDVVIEGGGAKGFVLAGAYAGVCRQRAYGWPGRGHLGREQLRPFWWRRAIRQRRCLAALEEQENGRSVFGGFLGRAATLHA